MLRVRPLRRAMTLVETMSIVVIMGVLATVAVLGVMAVRNRSQSAADLTRIATAQAAGRALAATNDSRFPEDIVARIPVQGVEVVEGVAASGGELSISRVSATTMTYVMRDRGGCVGLVDAIDTNTITWVHDPDTDPANCSAGVLGAKAPSLPPGGAPDRGEPLNIDFDTGVPAPPTGLTLSSNANGVTVSWDASPGPGLAFYKVYRGNDLIATVDADTLSFLDTGAPGGVAVSYRVGASNNLDEASAQVGPVTILTVPDAPGNVTAVGRRDLTEVFWDKPPGEVSSYRVFVNGNEVWQGTDLHWQHEASSTPPFEHSSNFTYQVVAENPSGLGKPSPLLEHLTVPAPPGGLVISTPEANALQLNWAAASADVIGYSIYVQNGSDWDLYGTVGPSPREVIKYDLSAGTPVSLAVASLNASGEGPLSAPATGVPIEPPITAPSGVTTTRGNGQVTVSWSQLAADAGHPVSGYRVYRDGVLGCIAVGETTTSCDVTGLTNGTTYNFTVAAYNDSGQGVVSGAVSGKPFTVPGKPVPPTSTADHKAATVAYTAPASDGGDPISHYYVQCVSTDGGTTRAVSNVTASPVMVPNLDPGFTYYCRHRAYNAAGGGSYSNYSNTFIPYDTPGVPGGVSATSGENGQTTVSWTPLTPTPGQPVEGYRVYDLISGNPVLACQVVGAAQTSCTITGLNNGSFYIYAVTAYYLTHESALSGYVIATPYTVPATPGAPSMTALVGGLRVHSWAKNGTGGSAYTAWQASCEAAGQTTRTATGTGTATQIDVTSLTAGVAYRCQVRAQNAAGWGPWGPLSTNAVAPPTVPSAPGVPTLDISGTTVAASWTKNSNGGSAFTGWELYCNSEGIADANGNIPPDKSRSVSGNVSSIELTGVSGGRYRCRVRGQNAVGWGPYGPYTGWYGFPKVPNAPGVPAVTASGSTLTVENWARPSNNGANFSNWYLNCTRNGVDAFTYAMHAGSDPATFKKWTITVSNGTYRCRVAAVNGIGVGPYGGFSGNVSVSA